MCWMPLLTESLAWRLYPAHELMSKGSLFPLLELWISSLCLSSGLQVVGLTGAGSLGSFCGQCSLLIRGRAVLGGVFTSWCFHLLLDQHIEQPYPAFCWLLSVARKAIGSSGRAGSPLHSLHGHTTLCLTSKCCLDCFLPWMWLQVETDELLYDYFWVLSIKMQPRIATWLYKAKMLGACSDYCQILNLAGVSEKLIVRCEFFHAFTDLSSQVGDQTQMFTVIFPKRLIPKGITLSAHLWAFSSSSWVQFLFWSSHAVLLR